MPFEIDWTAGVWATSYGNGPFHPAIQNGRQIYFWPNITFDTEQAAYSRAICSLADAIQPASDHIRDWNMSRVNR